MYVFHSDELVPNGYINSNFWSNKDSHQYTFDFVFTISGATIN